MHNWTPLDVAIPVDQDVFRAPSFKTDLVGEYVVWLDFDQHLNNRLRCEIGYTPATDCSASKEIFSAEWSLYENGKPIFQNEPYHPGLFSGSAEHFSIALGTFDGMRNADNQLALHILQASALLRARHPRLRVEAHQRYWEKWIIEGQMAFFFFGLVCFVCVSALIIEHCVRIAHHS